MAKKKTETPQVPPVIEETQTRPVRLDLAPEIHRLLRLVAADEEKSMAAYARDALADHLTEEAKKRGIKG
jgi:plasmid stability protein